MSWNSLQIGKILWCCRKLLLRGVEGGHLLIILYEFVTINARKFQISWFFGPKKCLTDCSCFYHFLRKFLLTTFRKWFLLFQKPTISVQRTAVFKPFHTNPVSNFIVLTYGSFLTQNWTQKYLPVLTDFDFKNQTYLNFQKTHLRNEIFTTI